jgi:lipid II:glycine glycyltransferase (peptidoglycan interpeptide bridge formation enzyme)
MTIRELSSKERGLFNNLATHPLQSWEWGEFRRALNQKVVRIGCFKKEKLIDAFQVFFYKLPGLPFTIGYLPKGRLPNKNIVQILAELGRKNKAVFIKLEPNIGTENKEVEKWGWKQMGLKQGKPIFTKFTSIINLNKSEEELFNNFKNKTRYNIRLAQKHGVVVEEDNSPKTFSQYLKLMLETTRRQGFYAHDSKFHQLQWQILQPAGISHLLVAKHKGKILAAFLLFLFNQTLYYPYGASTREEKELMAPNLLMWEAIRFGKKNGALLFDLWGGTSSEIKENDPWYGWHRFKMGYSPETIELVGAYDLVITPLLYEVYNWVDSFRWLILRLKAKI